MEALHPVVNKEDLCQNQRAIVSAETLRLARKLFEDSEDNGDTSD